jgi:hypothetical protein
MYHQMDENKEEFFPEGKQVEKRISGRKNETAKEENLGRFEKSSLDRLKKLLVSYFVYKFVFLL